MDAVLALRQYITSHKEAPKLDDDGNFVFDNGVKFPKTTETPVHSLNKGLTLASLVHGYESIDMKVRDYMIDARQKEVMRISQLDKNAIVAYLRGEKDWAPQIKHDRPDATSEGDGTQSTSAGTDQDATAGGGKADTALENKKKRKTDKNLAPEELLLRKVKKREGCQRDRDSVLQSSQRFVEALLIEKDQRKSSNDKRKAASKDAPAKKVVQGRPIIVVPATMTATLNMFNIKSFLENGVYITPTEGRSQNPNRAPALMVEKRLPDSGPCQFKVVDSVKKFQDHHWDRLAAVFTQGPKWQFKDWRWNDTATIFENCRGIHVHFDDHKLEPHLGEWNIVPFPLKKQSRFQDSVQVHKVWLEIENFLATKKPDLLEAAKLSSKAREN
mmetsp:Transcript_10491/g.18525  ORF Transcript_10491/g.18525 Transcript_10491/m.18525 type:complete len:386 (-) Transcript_10491:113-1270(-)|eukprot:CAMPEP_0184520594 /NCGR_PEP_ID=MMETSP0198_2-20121128/7255_1 /TAXON_ID=1112570 /ORGANISM="Thraustochytrium sp., Strain LLF1b" /LENGTH=385 /DNA_ID=CAMNT_0026911211 /DNA_START=168 /DNA_END=1325 /DNA_ORIENTATION=+